MSALPNLDRGEIAMIVVSVIVMIFLSYQILKWIHENKEEFEIKESSIPVTDIPSSLLSKQREEGDPKYRLPTFFDPGLSRRTADIKYKI